MRKNLKGIAFLCLVHFIIDGCANYLPIVIILRDLDKVKAGLIASITLMTANLLQPVFGILADKVRGRVVPLTALLVAPVFMSLIGLSANLILICIILLIARLGISLFHPAGAKMSSKFGGEHAVTSFTAFTFFGTMGFAFSSKVFFMFQNLAGLNYTFLLAVPALIVAVLYKRYGPEVEAENSTATISHFRQWFEGKKLLIGMLFLLTFLRAFVQLGLSFAVALVYKEWGFSDNIWNIAPTIMMAAGAFALLVGGIYFRNIKFRQLMIISAAGSFISLVVFVYLGSHGSNHSLWVLAILGLMMFCSFPANLVMGHKLVPEAAGTVSSILMGFSWGLGGFSLVFIPLLGNIKWKLPFHGLTTGLYGLAAFAFLWVIVSVLIPKDIDSRIGD